MTGEARPATDAVDALVARAVGVANEILQGETSPYDGAKALWRIQKALYGLDEALLVFVGLASEWEDSSEHRDHYEREIVVAADKFRARWD
jgi:hypothetical protein